MQIKKAIVKPLIPNLRSHVVHRYYSNSRNKNKGNMCADERKHVRLQAQTMQSIMLPFHRKASKKSQSCNLKKKKSKIEVNRAMSLGNDEIKGTLTFCQFFFNKETRKLTLSWTFWKICFSSMLTLPTATPMQSTFFSWNFTIAFVSLTFPSRDSWWETSVGNFPVE